MRRINRAFTNPVMRIVAGILPPLAVVHHVGRESGRPYRTPVLAFPTDEGYVTPLPYGTDTDWCLNVLKAGSCTLEVIGREIPVGNARIVEAEEAVPLLPALLRPGLRLANLPGYLLLDQRKAQAGRRRKNATK
jgi:deazaflavin-dependent oxidoreductase (nitroreductase family)